MDEEERREMAIERTAAALQPNFKSETITQHQLDKFKELHRRRLKIKTTSKFHKKSKGKGSGTAKDLNTKKIKHGHSSLELEDYKPSSTEENAVGVCSLQQDISTAPLETKKRQKLHWGLDTKERWERKSNM